MSCTYTANTVSDRLSRATGVAADASGSIARCFRDSARYARAFLDAAGSLNGHAPAALLPPQGAPPGFVRQNGHVTVQPVEQQPTTVLRFMSFNGYMYENQIRAVPWEEVPPDAKHRLWNEGSVADGKAPDSGVVYQAANLPAEEGAPALGGWDSADYFSSVETALHERLLWHVVERYPDVIEGQPHALYHIAAQQRERAREDERAREARETMQRAREQRRAAEEAAAFNDHLSEARANVVASRQRIPVHLWFPGSPTGFDVERDGINLLWKKDRESTGLGVYQDDRGQWQVVVLSVGLSIGEGFKTQRDALEIGAAAAGLINWQTIKKGGDVPLETKESLEKLFADASKYRR